MSRRFARIALWSALGATLAVIGYLLINTTFMPYDDEGFVLISLRSYLAGRPLYDEVFSQYGPWPYVYHQILTTLAGHAPMTHTLGRALTLGHWVGMSLLAGGVAWRLTRSQLAAGIAGVFVFGLTWQMVSEPSHPGSMICVLDALAGLVAARLPEADRPARHYAALGILCGLLLLTKVNVGLFLAAGVGGFTLWQSAWPGALRRVRWLAAAGLLALPWLLMGRQLHEVWALTFALQFTLAAAGLLWLSPTETGPLRLPARAWPAAVVAAAVTILAIVGWVVARGTTLTALVQAVLVSPLRMPAKFVVGTPWYAGTWVLAVAGSLAVARAGWELRQGGLANRTRWVVLAIRGAALGWLALHLAEWPSYFGIFHFAAYCLPLLPVFLVPLAPGATPASHLTVRAVAWIALTQVLHAFPVAGSQLGWATFLVVPLVIAGWWDTGRALPALLGGRGRRAAVAGATLLAAGALVLLALLGYTGGKRYAASRPLGLPGAEDIRLDGPMRAALRLLTLNASVHADLLVSRQGMYSYNLWSGVPTPTAQNATHWFWLLDERQQRAIVDRLAATPRTALIVSHSLDAFLAEHDIPVAGPIQHFLAAHYRPLFTYRDFSFEVPQDSRAVAFGRLEVRESTVTDPTVPPLLFRTNILLDGQPARIRLERSGYPWDLGPDLLAGCQVVVEPIDRTGRILGPAVPLPAATPLRGLFRLTILSPRLPAGLPWQEFALVVRDPDGNLLSESFY